MENAFKGLIERFPEVHVAFCANDRYLPGLLVAIRTCAEQLPSGRRLVIHVIDAGLSERSRQSIIHHYEGNPNISVAFLAGPGELFRSVKIVRYHISSYLRLALPELLEQSHIIYVDSDTVVLDDLLSVASQFERSPQPIAAAADWETKCPSQDSKELANHCGLTDCSTYFNSGVMGLNLSILRQEKFTQNACNLLSELGEYASFADQSAFNCLLAGRWMELDPYWNTPAWAFDQQKDNQLPGVLHYTNHVPWLRRRFTPSQALFERIARDLGVELPNPEIGLMRSCMVSLLQWLISPARVCLYLLLALVSAIRVRIPQARGRIHVCRHWFKYFFGGPARTLRYWRRIREIQSPSFDPFARRADV